MITHLLPQLFCALTEQLSRQAIKHDPAAQARLASLQQKQLAFTLKELKRTFVLGAGPDSLLLNQHNESVDCHITTDLASLRLLRDPSQLTRLIKTDALQIEGDLQVAQQYANFFQQLEPDWQSAMATYLGDALTHKVVITLEQARAYLQQKLSLIQQSQLELLQDELQLAPPRAEVEQFQSELNQLQTRLENLRRQLQQLQESQCV